MAKNKHYRYLLPVAALAGVLIGVISVFLSHIKPPTPSIPFPPPNPPFESYVAGEGLVEASSEDVALGSPFTEIVEEIFVDVGVTIAQGTPLFKLNTQILEAELEEAKANYEVSKAEYL
ncbi:MAG: hypothetical protein WAM28_00325, partial [Chlamydiales bacterium]